MDNAHQQILFELITRTVSDPTLKNNDGDAPLDIIEVPLAEIFELGRSGILLLVLIFFVIEHRASFKSPIMFHTLLEDPKAIKSLKLSDKVRSFQNAIDTS